MKNHDFVAYIWQPIRAMSQFWLDGNGEWETVRQATAATFPGHQWPRRPLQSYGNEADPRIRSKRLATTLTPIPNKLRSLP